MILVADSGSTKTDWRLVINEDHIVPVSTIGFNPYFIDTRAIAAELQKDLVPELNNHTDLSAIKDIYFYGAGCSTSAKCDVVHQALIKLFPKSTIHVDHDLLAAARALCGSQPGIAAILGTGSNSCYFDGKDITANVASNGYLLGDEGSGAHIGKTFIKYYLDNELPEELKRNFDQRLKLTREEIMDTIYRKTLPNRYLASFSKFVFQNIQHPFMVNLVADCFRQFFQKQICKYPQHKTVPLNCVGSVAYYFNSILTSVADEFGVRIGRIIETPIAALTLFHLTTPNTFLKKERK